MCKLRFFTSATEKCFFETKTNLIPRKDEYVMLGDSYKIKHVFWAFSPEDENFEPLVDVILEPISINELFE